MPRRAPRSCRKAGCKALGDKTGYCEAHRALAIGWNDQSRGTASERGYDHNWRKLRAYILRRDQGLCQPCKARGRVHVANEVDHIIPKSQGGTDDPVNLQAINRDCHREKTQAESRG